MVIAKSSNPHLIARKMTVPCYVVKTVEDLAAEEGLVPVPETRVARETTYVTLGGILRKTLQDHSSAGAVKASALALMSRMKKMRATEASARAP